MLLSILKNSTYRCDGKIDNYQARCLTETLTGNGLIDPAENVSLSII